MKSSPGVIPDAARWKPRRGRVTTAMILYLHALYFFDARNELRGGRGEIYRRRTFGGAVKLEYGADGRAVNDPGLFEVRLWTQGFCL